MNRKKLVIISSLVAVAISMAFIYSFEEYVYVQSDITKANPNLKVGKTAVSMATDIEGSKEYIILTILGPVTSVGDPIPWTDEAGNKHGAIQKTIKNITNVNSLH